MPVLTSEERKQEKLYPGFSVPLSEVATTQRNHARAMKALEI